jgi:hypothetical protein
MKKKNNDAVSGDGSSQASVGFNGNLILKLGLDLHYHQVTVAIQEDGGRIKAVGKTSHQAFGNWVGKKLKAGWQIRSCYEAGAQRLLVTSRPRANGG